MERPTNDGDNNNRKNSKPDILKKLNDSWEKAVNQPLAGKSPVDHFFPTQLTPLKMKLEMGKMENIKPEYGITPDEVKETIREILLFIQTKQNEQKDLENDWLSEAEEIWFAKPTETNPNPMSGLDLAKELGTEDEPWDPFKELK